jgi:hypothetical protein
MPFKSKDVDVVIVGAGLAELQMLPKNIMLRPSRLQERQVLPLSISMKSISIRFGMNYNWKKRRQ